MGACVGRRSSVMVRGDVRKDDQGFEDIDEFWADDDDFDPKDDDDDDDDDRACASILPLCLSVCGRLMAGACVARSMTQPAYRSRTCRWAP